RTAPRFAPQLRSRHLLRRRSDLFSGYPLPPRPCGENRVRRSCIDYRVFTIRIRMACATDGGYAVELSRQPVADGLFFIFFIPNFLPPPSSSNCSNRRAARRRYEQTATGALARHRLQQDPPC